MCNSQLELAGYSNFNANTLFGKSNSPYATEFIFGGDFKYEKEICETEEKKEAHQILLHSEMRMGSSKVPAGTLSNVGLLDPIPPIALFGPEKLRAVFQDNISDPRYTEVKYAAPIELKLQYLYKRQTPQAEHRVKIYAGNEFREKYPPISPWGGNPVSRYGMDFMGVAHLLGGGVGYLPKFDHKFVKSFTLEAAANCRDTKHCSFFTYASVDFAVSSFFLSPSFYFGYGNQAWPTDPNPDDPISGRYTMFGTVLKFSHPNWGELDWAYTQLDGLDDQTQERTQRRANVIYGSLSLPLKIKDLFPFSIQTYLVFPESFGSVPERELTRTTSLFFLTTLSIDTNFLRSLGEETDTSKKWNRHLLAPTLSFGFQLFKDLSVLTNDGIGSRPFKGTINSGQDDYMFSLNVSWAARGGATKKDKEPSEWFINY